MKSVLRRVGGPLACLAVSATALLTAGCGLPDAEAATSAVRLDCKPFAAYTGHAGTTVTFLRQSNLELVNLTEAMRDFSDCTSIKFVAKGTDTLEQDLQAAAPVADIGVIQQPGLLGALARAGRIKPVPTSLAAEAPKNFSKDWLGYATVDGTLYAMPFTAYAKSLIWYSPTAFRQRGFQVPTTWAELAALSDTVVKGGGTPWCDGFESGGATGWPGTDWVEDAMLRVNGPEDYDKWVSHAMPFNDPKVAKAVDWVGDVLKKDGYVHGGTSGIATRGFATAGMPILGRGCYLYRMASFYSGNWPAGTKITADGDVFAFYLPPTDPSTKPVLAGGDYLAAFNERPEVAAVLAYMSSVDFAKRHIGLGAGVSANKSVPMATYTNTVDALSAKILNDDKAVIRFDASDLMPAAVGAGTFWTGMVAWVKGESTTDMLAGVEKSWPKS